MALQILEKEGTFHLQGNLNSSTTRSFIIHFEKMINSVQNVKINIEKIKNIDESGENAFKTLIALAMRNNKLFYIVGEENKEIYEEYLYSSVA